MRFYYLYALLLQDNCYYVGVTSYKNAVKRYQQHLDGKGAKWTRLHKPIRMLEVRPIGTMAQSKACILEDQMTIEYMSKYGLDFVRGGRLCMVKASTVRLHYNEVSTIKVRKEKVYIPAIIKSMMRDEW